MKLILMALLFLSFSATAQNIKRDNNGNFYSISKPKKPDVKTNFIFTDSKGVKYPVYQNDKGTYFVIRTSKKTGKTYKVSLKP